MTPKETRDAAIQILSGLAAIPDMAADYTEVQLVKWAYQYVREIEKQATCL